MAPLFAKLRYKPGMRVCVLGAPSGFSVELARLPVTIERTTTLRGRFDIVHTFVTRRSQIARAAPRLKGALGPGGLLWVSYPKGDALGTDLKRDILHEILSEAGLDGVAQVAVDEVWSAMRFKVADRA
jgi:hypothetical protein